MVFYGSKHSYFWQIQQLQDQIETMREVVKAQQQQQPQFQLPSLNVKKAGQIVSQSILTSQFATHYILNYINRSYITSFIQQIEPALKVYREIPNTITDLKYQLINRYSLKIRLAATALISTTVCLRSLNTRPWNLPFVIGRTFLSYVLGSLMLTPELGPHYAKLLCSK